MSVSIGRINKENGGLDELFVCNQQIWRDIWEKAISDKNHKLIGCCRILHRRDLSQILDEFEQVKDYVQKNDFSQSDKDYVIMRVDEILKRFESFFDEKDGTDMLDMG